MLTSSPITDRRISTMDSAELTQDLDSKARHGDSVILSQDEMQSVLRNVKRKEQKISHLWRTVVLVGLCFVAFVVATVFSNITVNKSMGISTGTHIDSRHLATSDGSAVNVESSRSFGLLTDLLGMPMEFLRSMDSISYVVDGELEISRIARFRKSNKKLEVYLMDGSDVIHVYDESCTGRAKALLIRADGSKHDITGSDAHHGRRLAQAEGVLAYESMEQLYGLLTERELSTGDPMHALFNFFGGVAEGTISADTIKRAPGVPPAECNTGIKMPQVPLFSKWTIDYGNDNLGTFTMDLRSSPKIRMETPIAAANTLFITESHSSASFSYIKRDTRKLLLEPMDENMPCPDADVLGDTTCKQYQTALHERSHELLLDNVEEYENCHVSTGGLSEHKMQIEEPVLEQDFFDGSGIFNIVGMQIRTNTAGVPVEFIIADESGEVSSRAITSIEDMEGSVVTFNGCTTSSENAFTWDAPNSETRRRRLDGEGESTMVRAHDLVDAVLTQFRATELHESVKRRLSPLVTTLQKRELTHPWVTALASMATGTQWCGPGTDIWTTTCPNASDEGDHSCYRHDHGSKARPYAGVVKLGCSIDNDIQLGTDSNLVHAIFGPSGLARLWGCDDAGDYECGSWGWHRCGWRNMGWCYRYTAATCNGLHTHTGANRYTNSEHTWGYLTDQTWRGCTRSDGHSVDHESTHEWDEIDCPFGYYLWGPYSSGGNHVEGRYMCRACVDCCDGDLGSSGGCTDPVEQWRTSPERQTCGCCNVFSGNCRGNFMWGLSSNCGHCPGWANFCYWSSHMC